MTTELRFIPCAEFEFAIHEYVDNELATPDMKALLIHLELCECCSQAVELLRREVRAHREASEFQQVIASFDKGAFFEKLNGTLLASNVEKLAGLLYELGKAYFHAGNDSRLIAFLHQKTESIERSHDEGRRLIKETSGLAERTTGPNRKVTQSIRRAGQLFRGRRTSRIGSRAGRNSLDNARRFLEECLILNPEHPQARIYLGYYFVRVDRPDEGLREYRKLLALPNLNKTMRVMTLQAMGNAHAYRLEYEKAIECFQLIVAEGVLDNDPRFFTVLLSLAMFYAKLGNFDQSSQAFGELVDRFPQMVERARDMLEQAEVFRALLAQQTTFRSELLQRYPMLFAG